MEALIRRKNRVGFTEQRFDQLAMVPAVAAICYPFLLKGFHLVAGPPGSQPLPLACAGAILILSSAFAVPMLGIALACRHGSRSSLRRLGYASVLSPTLYVFLGVVQMRACLLSEQRAPRG
jgi:hypothetical protein